MFVRSSAALSFFCRHHQCHHSALNVMKDHLSPFIKRSIYQEDRLAKTILSYLLSGWTRMITLHSTEDDDRKATTQNWNPGEKSRTRRPPIGRLLSVVVLPRSLLFLFTLFLIPPGYPFLILFSRPLLLWTIGGNMVWCGLLYMNGGSCGGCLRYMVLYYTALRVVELYCVVGFLSWSVYCG
ncbi:hypothetical protein F4810DRAFT_322094 [Camillea tinctor]|nr:hypothetical protein F4810DRAFT_322094 [Camillea tinctor]